MGSGNKLDDLARAAEAAGFAMAGAADDFDVQSESMTAKVPVESVARGFRPDDSRPNLPILTRSTRPARSRLASGAHAVRESLYGYLGLGIPA